MRFEKWQALGNDYAIVEERELPFELTPERVRALCAPHTGVGSDGILLLRETDERGFVAELRIFNPDGSEAELSGNGVREAVMYLRRKRLDRRTTRSRSAPRPARSGRASPGRAPARVDMGRARLTRRTTSRRAARTAPARWTSAGREFAFQFVQVGNPQCSIEVAEGLEELDLERYGPPIERHELFPDRTNVSFWRRTGDAAIRARIFERGVGETMSSGTGATRRRRGRGAARGRQPGDRARSTAASSRWRWARTCTWT